LRDAGVRTRAAAGFGLTILLGAFLLFQIQPLVSKHILPWFGGSPSVWTTCLLFFQVTLLAGYAYAHGIARLLAPRAQAVVHALLIVAALWPSILPGSDWAPQSGQSPVLRILAMLLVSVGLPYFVLASTSPLIQSWLHRIVPGRAPWRLYAISNAGSMLAVISYPILIEPQFAVSEQARIWRWCFVVFAILCGTVLWRLVRAPAAARVSPEATAPVEPARGEAKKHRPLYWVAWSATSVVLFMAVTNQLSLNIASIPLLWVLPLGTYLASFIVAFGGPRFYPRRLFALLLGPAILAFYVALPGDVDPALPAVELSALASIILAIVALFVCCLVCHGELYRIRPEPERLTGYYLLISVGGVIGGVLVGVVAPHVFLLYSELQIGLLTCAVLFSLTAWRDRALFPVLRRRLGAGLILGALGLIVAMSVVLTVSQLRDTIYTKRNFFGLIRVRDVGRDDPGEDRHLELAHGSTLHGIQFVAEPLRRLPTLYYGPISGVGFVMQSFDSPEGRAVGLVGMGAATLAAYGTADDHFCFYEIDPDVVHVAKTYFTFLADTEATWEAVVGDGRLRLERDAGMFFDILVLDAFGSDAIPVHLLTIEAFQLYERRLKEGGVIAFHISNHHLDLAPVVSRIAAQLGFRAVEIANRDEPGGPTGEATWVVLSRKQAFFERLETVSLAARKSGVVRIWDADPERYRAIRTWTDDYSNVFQILRR
jgi:hypothetical protein